MVSSNPSFPDAFAAWRRAFAAYEEAAQRVARAREATPGSELQPLVDLVTVCGIDLERAHELLLDALRNEGCAGADETGQAEPAVSPPRSAR
jgi:hypothetical protein